MAISTKGPDSTKRSRTRNSASTENKILTAAENLFAQNGYDAVATKQLATTAGNAD